MTSGSSDEFNEKKAQDAIPAINTEPLPVPILGPTCQAGRSISPWASLIASTIPPIHALQWLRGTQQWPGVSGICRVSPTNVLKSPYKVPSVHGLFDRRHLGGGSLIVARVCWVDIAPDPRRGRAPVSRRIGKSGRFGVVAWGWDEQKGGRPGSLGKVNPAILFQC